MLQQTTCSKQQWQQHQEEERELEQQEQPQQPQQQQQQQEQQQTAKASSYSNIVRPGNMGLSNMLPASNSTTTTIDFNSRRRRGRLRAAHKCCQQVPATNTNVAYTKQQQTKQPKHHAKLLLSIMCAYIVDCVNILKRLVLLTLTTTTATKKNNNSNRHARGRGQPLCCLMLLLLLLFFCSVQAHKPKSVHKQQHQPAHNNDVTFNNMADVPPTYQVKSSQTSNEDEAEILYHSAEMFGEEEEDDLSDGREPSGRQVNEDNAANPRGINDSLTDSSNTTKTPLFPKDLFTKEQLENGAVILHIIGVIYMFVALAIVCDEFFVPSLDVIIEKLGITDDVAGATFMAAGGSAPELFTSVIGVFVSFDDVGIGTIVGSAVFNILFVIGMCALFSRTVLSLTWWPLFRDCSFYSISLLVLIYFFRDNRIFWWEALILFTIYIAYVTFMKWNVQVEHCVKKMITKNKVTRVRSTDQLMPAGNAANSSETSMATQPGGSVTSRAASETRSGPAGSSNAGATDDVPGKVDEKATQLHAIASLKVLLDATKPQRGGATTSAANHVKINLKETTLADRPNGNIDTTLDSPSLSGRRPSWIEQRVKIQTRKFSIKAPEIIEDEPEPLSMAWPDTARKRLTYVLVAPLLVPMWLTLPDTRTPRGKRYFPVTFIGSIVWIAAFSYLMVWWANVAGDTARIPPEVMGLTFLAAGTSIPDLITSVIVARKGFGDMAVSSSVGSNIFDVTVGLPIPWLLYGIIYDAPVEVNSVGMVCSITILFMMLVFVVLSIACFRWRMNKGLGFTMFLLYFVFVAVSLMFEYDLITCPV
ncbi:sodium/potassium/calcium exchanger Nckx30C isoform X6 [Drosophila hydei]|uniref:Sodium/potassium/calcium exchanger Nckx30C isoform X6 n=1 Tax=Drosophila hydei TaxID=7224 RepID=A0A6J1LF11_DROHY|nr:sodium/potassium/calcium exchanger Nckx30C isoform X6 [Drosophila hydei]